MKRTWLDYLIYGVLAIFGFLSLASSYVRSKADAGIVEATIPCVAIPGPDASGATGRAGDSLTWEIYAEDPDLGRVPVQVWVHGPGWSVTCQVRPPGSVPASGCVTAKEPARLEGARQ